MRTTPLFSGLWILWHVVAYVAILFTEVSLTKGVGPSRSLSWIWTTTWRRTSWRVLAEPGWTWKLRFGTSAKSLLSRYVFVGSWPDICWQYIFALLFYMVGKKVVAVLFPKGTWLTCWSICSQSLPLESIEPVDQWRPAPNGMIHAARRGECCNQQVIHLSRLTYSWETRGQDSDIHHVHCELQGSPCCWDHSHMTFWVIDRNWRS